MKVVVTVVVVIVMIVVVVVVVALEHKPQSSINCCKYSCDIILI